MDLGIEKHRGELPSHVLLSKIIVNFSTITQLLLPGVAWLVIFVLAWQ